MLNLLNLLQKSFWLSVFGKSAQGELSDLENPNDQMEGFFEPEPEGLDAGIVVRNLRKVFKSLTGMLLDFSYRN